MLEKQSSLAYAAGFIDGEGTICIDKRGAANGRKPTTYLKVEAAQVVPEPLDILRDLFGGYVKHATSERNIFRWRVDSYKAYNALVALRPYLVVKAGEADVAIAYWEHRLKTKAGTAANSRITMPMDAQLEYRSALKRLKRERPLRYEAILRERPELLPRKRQVKPATSFAAGQSRNVKTNRQKAK